MERYSLIRVNEEEILALKGVIDVFYASGL
jgi:hypothetical protein